MKKRVLLLAVAGLVVVLVAGAFWFAERRNTGEGSEASVDPLIEATTLAIKGINLMQGEKGFEFWRLKAEWAAMHQEKDVIDVREPKVRYTLGEGSDDDYVYATSEYGRVTDQQHVLTMWQNVRLTRGEDTLTGPELTYRTDERLVRFPKGGVIVRPTMTGSFGVLAWDMNANRIDADEGVDIVFEVRPSAPGPEQGDAPLPARPE